ncbi:MAG: signal recognition particle-docking protein FtsY [Planctomycetota bacterium]|nr:signal recognition particle-docking protein FtsY [Planctomycetota bacterium]
MGLFDRLKKRLTRTRSAISDGISSIFHGGRAMDQELLDDLEELLYTSDLGPLAADLIDTLTRMHKRGELKGEDDVRCALRGRLLEKLGDQTPLPHMTQSPHVLLVVGVNGSGKTTSIAKLAYRFKSEGKSVLVGACDTFRAAAADQLEIWADRAGVDLVRQGEGADPAAVAFDAVDAGISRGSDVIILDTAGRLHTQKNLMQELEKIQRVVRKRLPDAPHSVWLVLDGTNGQNAVQQAKLFMETVDVSGLIVAKLDGTARGGAVFSITDAVGLPVFFVGTGETMEDLERFEPGTFVDAILSTTLESA